MIQEGGTRAAEAADDSGKTTGSGKKISGGMWTLISILSRGGGGMQVAGAAGRVFRGLRCKKSGGDAFTSADGQNRPIKEN